MKHHIWVIPSEPLYSDVQKTIRQLSEEYNGPIFEPHMTVLADIDKDLTEMEPGFRELAKSVKNQEFSLGPISFSTTYFQSVFVRVNSTAQLMQLNLDAKEKFSKANDLFMPHISLLYGEQDMSVRESAALKVKLPVLSFVAKELAIITTISPDPGQWKRSATISF